MNLFAIFLHQALWNDADFETSAKGGGAASGESSQTRHSSLLPATPASLRLTPHPALTRRLQTPSAAAFDVMFAPMYSRVNHTHLQRAAWNSIQWVCWPVLSEDSEGD